MSSVDIEVLYLILTKVAAGATFYNYDPKQLPPGSIPGTITKKHLAEVYERITGLRTSGALNWGVPIKQIQDILARCKLPSLAPVVVDLEATHPSTAERVAKARATQWPAFSALKDLYKKGG